MIALHIILIAILIAILLNYWKKFAFCQLFILFKLFFHAPSERAKTKKFCSSDFDDILNLSPVQTLTY